MNNSIDISKISLAFSRFFKQFHATIYFAIIGVSLAVSVLVILQVLNLSNANDDAAVKPISQSFDENTIERVNQLNSNGTGSSIQTSGRSNPFSE